MADRTLLSTQHSALSAPRVALVHDYLNQHGGAERVLEELHALWPAAPIYTSMYAPDLMPAPYRRMDVRTSFMQRLPGVGRHHQKYLLAYPLAFESFQLGGYDVVLSNSSAWAKGVITPPETLHVCYCLTPMRWAWSYREYVDRERVGAKVRKALQLAIHYLRLWDAASAQRVDRYLAISRAVAARIRKYYRRDAEVIYPPVSVERFTPRPVPDDPPFYLIVSRLIPYKRVDLAVDAFNRLGWRLKIVGDGRDRAALQARARPNVEFLGHLPDDAVRDLMARCQAFLFPGLEDFGIAPVEAQAAGRPVVAYAGGGALDTVLDGETGVHFTAQTADALADAVRRSADLSFDPLAIRAHADRFSAARFRQQLTEYVERAWLEHGNGTMSGPGSAAPISPGHAVPRAER
jgi:glycosyltransferase involved in cell wall biosynthesis